MRIIIFPRRLFSWKKPPEAAHLPNPRVLYISDVCVPEKNRRRPYYAKHWGYNIIVISILLFGIECLPDATYPIFLGFCPILVSGRSG